MSFATDLSVIVPGRNEEFMMNTVCDVFENMEADTEVIAVCDGGWPNPAIPDHPKLKVIYSSTAIGQRAATNVGAGLSRAKYIMKMDAHCGVDVGFDRKLIEDMQPDWTMIPSMHRFHIFDWACCDCGERTYQGSKPDVCAECGHPEFYKHMVWEPRTQYEPTVSWRFDRNMQFQYWRKHKRRESVAEQVKSGLVETMSCIGCCFMMERERFWKLGGMDEGHGSWGQFGTELACKSWLSGGKMVTSLKTWVGHLFRTGNFSRNGESSWPYPITTRQVNHARRYSRDVWLNNKWEGQVLPLSWLLERFWPVPDWDESELKKLKEQEKDLQFTGGSDAT